MKAKTFNWCLLLLIVSKFIKNGLGQLVQQVKHSFLIFGKTCSKRGTRPDQNKDNDKEQDDVSKIDDDEDNPKNN